MSVSWISTWLGMILAVSALTSVQAEEAVLRLGIRADAAPFSARVDTVPEDAVFDAAYSGFSVSVCRAVVDRVKRDRPELRVEAVPVTAQTRFPEVEDAEPAWDLLCDPTSVTVARFAWCNFSFPYFVTGIAFATKDGTTAPKDLGGQKAALVGSTTADTGLKLEWSRKYGTPPEFVVEKNYEDAVQALKDGKVKAVFGDQVLLLDALETASMPAAENMSKDVLSIELYSVCIDPAQPELLAAANAALADLYRSGEIIELLGESFGGRGANRLLSTLYRLHAVPEM